jgi:hypothetical protein
MVLPLDPALHDMAKYIAEQHVEIAGPFYRRLNNELIYSLFRNNEDPIDKIFTKSLEKFLFSKAEVENTFMDLQRFSETGEELTPEIRNRLAIMGAMGIRPSEFASEYTIQTPRGVGTPYAGAAAGGGGPTGSPLGRNETESMLALDNDPDFQAVLQRIMADNDVTREDVYAIIRGESRFNPQARSPGGGYGGLFQMGLGTMHSRHAWGRSYTSEEIRQMTPTQQIELYEQILAQHRDRGWSGGREGLALMQAAPASLSRNIGGDEDLGRYFPRFGINQRYWNANPGWRTNPTGPITPNSIARYYFGRNAVPPLGDQSSPQIPTSVVVAERATATGAMDVAQPNLIGVFGTPSDPRARVRLSDGRVVQVFLGQEIPDIPGSEITEFGTTESGDGFLTFRVDGQEGRLEVGGRNNIIPNNIIPSPVYPANPSPGVQPETQTTLRLGDPEQIPTTLPDDGASLNSIPRAVSDPIVLAIGRQMERQQRQHRELLDAIRAYIV